MNNKNLLLSYLKNSNYKKNNYKKNINIKINHQAGIFSIFSLCLMIAIELNKQTPLESFIITDSFNCFKFINDENNNQNFEIFIPNIYYNNLDITNIYQKNFELGKQILKKYKLKSEIIEKAITFKNKFNINENSLGVHIRLTDMNINHGYSRLTLDDYIKKIEKILSEKKNIDNIFIASDNNESITNLIKYFENSSLTINYIPDLCRSEKEEATLEWTQKQFWYLNNENETIKENFMIDSFMDMLCLSYCGYLIHRISNVSNFAILFSDTLKETFKMD